MNYRVNIFLNGIIAVLILLFGLSDIKAQQMVNISIAVSPPYSTKISDYTATPNKIMATLTNISPDGAILSVYLAGSFISDGGIEIRTQKGFRPNAPIVLMPGIPYFVTRQNLENIFDPDKLDYKGITKHEIVRGNGLPEDNYVICLQAFEYHNHQKLSDDEPLGCSGMFAVSRVEPPVIINPICEAEINSTNPQNIMFSWTRPSGAPINIQYLFRLVEVIPGSRDPNNAFHTSGKPYFFEFTTSSNALIYGPGQPALVPGKIYAFSVTAVDPMGRTSFSNFGTSEVCSFTYSKNDLMYVPPVNVLTSNTGFNDDLQLNSSYTLPQFILPTVLKGKIKYKYSDFVQLSSDNLQNANIRLEIIYCIKNSSGFHDVQIANIGDDYTDNHKTIAYSKTDYNGEYSFIIQDAPETGLLEKNYTIGHYETGIKGDLYRYFKIVIDGQHKQFYLNPEKRFQLSRGETNNSGTAISYVRSFELRVKTKPYQWQNNDFLQNEAAALEGIRVYVLRPLDFSYGLFPLNDGSPKSNIQSPFPQYQVVAMTRTDANGVAVFKKLVLQDLQAYNYVYYAESEPGTRSNYKPTGLADFSFYFPSGISQISPLEASEFKDYKYPVIERELKMWAAEPKVSGVILNEEDNKPIEGALVTMNELYSVLSGESIALGANYTQEELALYGKILNSQCPPCVKLVKRTFITGADGRFEFSGLSVSYNKSKKTVTGPARSLKVNKPGFNDKISLIKNNQPMKYGEAEYKELQLKKGAMAEGIIADGETGIPQSAFVKFEGSTQMKFCNNGIIKNLPAMLLPGKKQNLIVQSSGYITDTFEIEINNKLQKLDTLKIFTLKRRLKIEVLDYTTNQPILDADVEIEGVDLPCKIKHGNYYIPSFCPAVVKTNQKGIASFSFSNAGDDNSVQYTIKASIDKEGTYYEAKTITTKIPYSQTPKVITLRLKRATCLKGRVFAGASDSSAVKGAVITMDIMQSYWGMTFTTGNIEAITDENGYFLLKNVPVRDYPQIVRASKSQSQLIGDSLIYNFNSAGSSCVNHNFHLSIYNDMDITNLMGFPIAVNGLKEMTDKSVVITGIMTDMAQRNNDQFSVEPNTKLRFVNIAIKPGKLKNNNGIPVSEPVVLPVQTSENQLKIKVYNSFDAMLADKNIGIHLDNNSQSNNYGIIKGKVLLDNKNFSQTGFILPAISLAVGKGSNSSLRMIPVLHGNQTVKKPADVTTGFYLCDSDGKSIRYSLTGFDNAAVADSSKSFLMPGKIRLFTSLNTKISNALITEAVIKIGGVDIPKNGPFIVNGSKPVTVKLEEWTLECKDWTLDKDGFRLNNALIKTGFDIKCSGVQITKDQLLTDKIVVKLDTFKILGNKSLIITGSNKGMNNINVQGQQTAWQIYVSVAGAETSIGYMPGLPSLAIDDKLYFTSLRLLSNGYKSVVPSSAPKLLHNIVLFKPYSSSPMDITTNYFSVGGTIKHDIPDVPEIAGSWLFQKSGNDIVMKLHNFQSVLFTKNKLNVKLNEYLISQNLFNANGSVWETGEFPLTRIILSKSPQETKIDIAPNEKIQISADNSRYFDKVTGGMKVVNNKWDTFWFEGEMIGMKGVSESKQRMKFIVDGAVVADGQTIQVKNVPGCFPGMSWKYDMQNSRLTGTCNLNQDISGLKLNYSLEGIVDNDGWYFKCAGLMDIPGFAGGNLFGLFGDYNNMPGDISAGFGSFACLPPSFQNKVSGFLLSAGIKKPIIPGVNYDFVVVSAKAGLDLYFDGRIYMAFDQPQGNVYGINALARGHAYAGGRFSPTCTEVDVSVPVEVGVGGEYFSNGSFNLDGCAGVSLVVTGTQCCGLPLTGICDWDDETGCCLSLDLIDLTIGATVKMNSNGNFNIGVTTSKCSSCK